MEVVSFLFEKPQPLQIPPQVVSHELGNVAEKGVPAKKKESVGTAFCPRQYVLAPGRFRVSKFTRYCAETFTANPITTKRLKIFFMQFD